MIDQLSDSFGNPIYVGDHVLVSISHVIFGRLMTLAPPNPAYTTATVEMIYYAGQSYTVRTLRENYAIYLKFSDSIYKKMTNAEFTVELLKL